MLIASMNSTSFSSGYLAYSCSMVLGVAHIDVVLHREWDIYARLVSIDGIGEADDIVEVWVYCVEGRNGHALG